MSFGFGVGFRGRFGMPFGVLFGIFLDPFGSLGATMEHFGIRGTTKNRDVLVFCFGFSLFDPRG